MKAEQPIFTKERCIAHAKKQLELAKNFRLRGDVSMSIYCLSRAADWRGHAATYNH
jgi:hypothetical protein